VVPTCPRDVAAARVDALIAYGRTVSCTNTGPGDTQLGTEYTDVNGDFPALSHIRHRERQHDPLRRFMPALLFCCCLVKRGAALRPTVRLRGRSLRMRNGCV